MGCASSAPATPAMATPVLEIPSEDFHKHYDLKQELGRGAFAQVRLCVSKTTCHESAVKVLKSSCEKQQIKAAYELKVWKQLGAHENVVELLDSYVEPGVHYFVMERCSHSINEKFPLRDNVSSYVEFLGAYQQVFLGLAHCHSMNIVHRDIKSANLLVDSSGTVKIADFGLSISMPAEGGITGIVGSTPFMCPEMIKGKTYGFDADIWGCGALIYHCVYGSYAYDSSLPCSELTLDERRRHMTRAIANDYPKPAYKTKTGAQCLSNSVREFIKTLLQRRPETRPKAESCAQMISEVKMELQNTKLHGNKKSTSSNSSTLKRVTMSKDDNEDAESLDTRCPSDYPSDSTWSPAPSGISYGTILMQQSL